MKSMYGLYIVFLFLPLKMNSSVFKFKDQNIHWLAELVFHDIVLDRDFGDKYQHTITNKNSNNNYSGDATNIVHEVVRDMVASVTRKLQKNDGIAESITSDANQPRVRQNVATLTCTASEKQEIGQILSGY